MALELRAKRIVKDKGTKWERINWLVDVPKGVRGDARQRKHFSSEAAALQYIDSFTGQLKEFGQRGVRNMGGYSVSQAVTEFYRSRAEKKGTHNYRLAAFWLDKFKETFGSLQLKAIAGRDLESFWKSGAWGPNSQKQAFTYLRLFFNWCERQDWLEKNPANRVEPPKGEKPKRRILTPEQMANLLEETESDPAMRAYLCLGGFAGLRTSEITSGKVVIEKTEIHVQDGKTGGRYVARLPVFDRWWPGEYTAMDDRTFRRHRDKLVARAELEQWPENGLRHSFASYYLANCEDAGKTAYQLGHTSPQMVYKAYARAVKKEDSLKWWTIGLPANVTALAA